MKVTSIPDTGFVRLSQIIGNPKATPPIPPIIPISRSSIWQMSKDGRFPKPVKLSERCTAWRVEDLRAFIRNVAA